MKKVIYVNYSSKALMKRIFDTSAKYIPCLKERGDLESKHSDELDFIEIPVWELNDALLAAYRLGLQDAQHRKDGK